eukprot:g46751.t1
MGQIPEHEQSGSRLMGRSQEREQRVGAKSWAGVRSRCRESGSRVVGRSPEWEQREWEPSCARNPKRKQREWELIRGRRPEREQR